MLDTFRLELVTPTRVVAEVDVHEVEAPGELGEFGVLVGHTVFLSVVRPGELRFTKDGTVHRFAVGNGFAQVGDNLLSILTDQAEEAESLNDAAIRQDLTADEARLKVLSPVDGEYAAVIDRIERNRARLHVASRR